jgi:hypothetical protein
VDETKLQELAARFQRAKEAYEEAKQRSNELYHEWNKIRMQDIPAAFEEMGIDGSVRVKGYGRLGLTDDLSCSINADHKDEAYAWLADRGLNPIPTINSSTLKAFIKEEISKGEPVPDDLFKLSSFSRASLTK